MSRSYPANTQIQKFLEESYNRERDARLSWYQKTKSDEEKQGSKQFEVFKKKIEAACPKPTDALLQLRHTKPKNYHKRVVKYDGNIEQLTANLKPVDKNLLVEMHGPPERQRTMLYDGFTKEGKGRYQYLQSRYKTEIPEEKFSFPVLSSWEYGWRLGDVINKDEIHKPTHGRTRIVADTFYTRTGIPALSAAF